MKAHEVKTTKTSHIYSDTTSSDDRVNALVVSADEAQFLGSNEIDYGVINAKKLDHAENLIGQTGQSSKQQFSKSLSVSTEQKVVIDERVKPRACDVSVAATSIDVNKDYKSQHAVSLVATEGSIEVNANVSGTVTVLDSEKSNVNLNNGVTVRGTEYAQVHAGNNVELHAAEREFRGAHDTEKEYRASSIIGGKGTEGSNGVGACVMADNKAIIDASNIGAEGDVVVSGKNGVEVKARVHTYVAEKWKENKRILGIKHGEKKYERTDTTVATSTFASKDASVRILSENGAVDGVAGNFVAAKGTEIRAKKNINLKSVITETKVHSSEKGAFGLNSSKRNESHQEATLVEFVSGGDTCLHSQDGSISGQDVRFRGNGNLAFEAKNGFIELKTSKLNHHVSEKSRRVSVDVPALRTVKNLKERNFKEVVQQLDPVLSKAEALYQSNDLAEVAANGFNAGVSAYNSATSIAEGVYGQQLMQNAGLVPKATVKATKAKSSSDYQTVSDGGIHQEGSVTFKAKNNVDLEGMPINADGLVVEAKSLKMKGHELLSSSASKVQSSSVGMTLTGDVTDVSVSQSRSKMHATHHQQMDVTIKNEVKINVRDADLDNAYIDCQTITGEVNQLKITSRQDEMHASSRSVSASTTGAVSMHKATTDSKRVASTAGIHSRSDITDAFKVNKAELTGAEVVSDGHNGFKPDSLETKDLHDYSRTRSRGFSGNVNVIAKACSQLSDSANEENNASGSHRLNVVTVSRGRQDVEAVHRATIYGSNGVHECLTQEHPELNISSRDARLETKNEKRNLTLDIPVEMVTGAARKATEVLQRDNATTQDRLYESSASEILDQLRKQEGDELNVDDDEIEYSDDLSDSVSEECDSENTSSKKPGVFNQDIKTQKLGRKSGRGDKSQWYEKSTGKYTNLKKELQKSAEKSQVTDGVDIVLLEKGEKYNGAYFTAKIDPKNRQLVIDGGLGQEHRVNIGAGEIDLGSFGSVSYAVDAASVEALLRVSGGLDATSASLDVNVSVGVTGPSLSGSYSTPSFRFFGLTLKGEAEGSVGLGDKIVGGVGAEADAKKMKAGVHVNAGLFSGVGASGKFNFEVGMDAEFFEYMDSSYQEIVKQDPVAMTIIEKLETYQPLTEWERDYFDSAMESVPIHAQAQQWLGSGK